MRSVVALAPSRVARTVLVPEVLPADEDGAEPAAVPLRSPFRGAAPSGAPAADYAASLVRRGDLVDVYC
jgi:hypothetical protein